MTTNQKLREIYEMAEEQKNQLAVSLPQPTLDFLLAKIDKLQRENTILKSNVRYYKRVHPEARREVKMLRKELNRLRKEQAHGQASAQA